jgi:hypothetical protein
MENYDARGIEHGSLKPPNRPQTGNQIRPLAKEDEKESAGAEDREEVETISLNDEFP